MEEKLNAIDRFGAICQLKATKGWEVLMERYAKEGDTILTKILDVNTDDKTRTLYVYQLETLGVISRILADIEQEAKNEQARQKEPSHIGK